MCSRGIQTVYADNLQPDSDTISVIVSKLSSILGIQSPSASTNSTLLGLLDQLSHSPLGNAGAVAGISSSESSSSVMGKGSYMVSIMTETVS